MSEKPTVDTSWEMKWMRSLRKRAINILARIENDRKPTQELHYELRKAMKAFTYWNSDIAMWEKPQMIIHITKAVPQAELQEAEVDPIESN